MFASDAELLWHGGVGFACQRGRYEAPRWSGVARKASGLDDFRLIPAPPNLPHTMPITPHGRPAGEQWRGGPGGGFASSTGSKSWLRQGERPLGPDSSKNRRPEAAIVSLFKLLRGDCRFGVRPSSHNRRPLVVRRLGPSACAGMAAVPKCRRVARVRRQVLLAVAGYIAAGYVFVSACGQQRPALCSSVRDDIARNVLRAGCNSPPAVKAAMPSPRALRESGGQQIRCNSGADGIVRMKENGTNAGLPRLCTLVRAGGRHRRDFP